MKIIRDRYTGTRHNTLAFMRNTCTFLLNSYCTYVPICADPKTTYRTPHHSWSLIVIITQYILPEESITQPDRHRLRLRVVGQRRLAQFTSDTRLLEATEWKLVVEHVVAVDPYRPGLERVADADGRVDVLRVYGGGKTIGGAVTELDGVLLGLEFGDRADGAEDLLLHDLHVFADVGEDGGFDEVALVTFALATNFNLGALLLAVVDVAKGKCEHRSSEWILAGLTP